MDLTVHLSISLPALPAQSTRTHPPAGRRGRERPIVDVPCGEDGGRLEHELLGFHDEVGEEVALRQQGVVAQGAQVRLQGASHDHLRKKVNGRGSPHNVRVHAYARWCVWVRGRVEG